MQSLRKIAKKTDEEAQEKGEEAIVGNFSESNLIGGSEPEEELITPTDDICFRLSAQGNAIIDYKDELEECTTDVVIPSSINGTTINDISSNAFRYNQLTSVIIPDSVTIIRYAAFENNQLTSVTIPDSVTSIGSNTFWNNPLTSASVPSHLTFHGSVFPRTAEVTIRP